MPTCAPSAVLVPQHWCARAHAHAERADALTAARRRRSACGQKHPIEDFLYEYYSVRPGSLRRWHPGAGVALGVPPEKGPDGADDGASDRSGPGAPDSAAIAVELDRRAGWRWHRRTDQGAVVLDNAAYLADRGDGVRWLARVLGSTAGRPAHLGCLGLHEWAMVYRQSEHRHPLPLRLGQAGTDAVVDAHPVRCSHFDAFRFFTDEARPLNRLQPTRAAQPDLEQPGCLHANMDLLKAALKLGPACPGELLLGCFELARDIRVLDMQASPYDLTGLGHEPVTIETAAGRAEYVARQRRFAERAGPLREQLLQLCRALLAS